MLLLLPALSPALNFQLPHAPSPAVRSAVAVSRTSSLVLMAKKKKGDAAKALAKFYDNDDINWGVEEQAAQAQAARQPASSGNCACNMLCIFGYGMRIDSAGAPTRVR